MNTEMSPSAARLNHAQKFLLEANDLDFSTIGGCIGALSSRGTDFADLFFETSASEEWRLEQGKVTRGNFAIRQGVGARAVSGDKTAFAYSSAMNPPALAALASATRGMQRQGQDSSQSGGVAIVLNNAPGHNLYPAGEIASTLASIQKIELLQQIDRSARASDPRISQVMAGLTINDVTVLVAASDGTLSADVRPLVRVTMTVLAESGPRRGRGIGGIGGRFSLEELTPDAIAKMVSRAVRTALVNLEARPAPAGEMSVVLAPGFPGILLHEAVGHGLEGDFHRKRESVFAGLMGETVASPDVTVVDDATIPRVVGSLNVDDEGTPGQHSTLIEKGKLVGLMQDRTNARLMNDRLTGNGRRQSYSHLPLPRMTNTYLAAGTRDPEEIVRSVKRGIYASEFAGGTVDIANGQFNFSANEAWLIEDGKLTAPLEGATLIGIGHQSLKHVTMVGTDMRLDDGEATCGKAGQMVGVCVGQPTIRIDKMIVGGAG